MILVMFTGWSVDNFTNFWIVQVGQAMLRLEDRENVGKVILSTEEYEDANSFHGEDVSTVHREIQ